MGGVFCFFPILFFAKQKQRYDKQGIHIFWFWRTQNCAKPVLTAGLELCVCRPSNVSFFDFAKAVFGIR
jgi:hypothetical protein